jgi:hypothetical protein
MRCSGSFLFAAARSEQKWPENGAHHAPCMRMQFWRKLKDHELRGMRQRRQPFGDPPKLFKQRCWNQNPELMVEIFGLTISLIACTGVYWLLDMVLRRNNHDCVPARPAPWMVDLFDLACRLFHRLLVHLLLPWVISLLHVLWDANSSCGYWIPHNFYFFWWIFGILTFPPQGSPVQDHQQILSFASSARCA